MSTFLVFAVCGFASSFSLRLIDPLVLPVATHFAVAPNIAALLSPAYSLPYALSQPFLGPLSDRFGRVRCIQVCMAGLALVLVIGTAAPSFESLLASRVIAGIFGGGLIPLVLAALGDDYDMSRRQVVIGRMLFALIGGQMLGSVVSGFANEAFGWRSALAIAAALAVAAAVLAWTAFPRQAPPAHAGAGPSSFRTLYGRVFANPKAGWLLACVFAEGALFFGLFPHIGEVLQGAHGSPVQAVSRQAGLVLGAFGIGGLLYALTVRRLIALLGVSRMCLTASVVAAGVYAGMAAFGPWWQAALAMLVCGLAFYMLHNSLQTEATEIAPSARGSAVALFACALFLGQGVGPLLFGPLAQALGHAGAFLVFALGMLVLGQVVVRRIVRVRAPAVPRSVS